MSVAASTHASNVIDAGDTATVSATVTGDLLSLGGTMTGDTVVDLSSTTDQISSISGVANAAVQKGFESVDASNAAMVGTVKFTITGSTGINHITGDSGADVISAGDGADIITGKGGADVMTGGAGRDKFAFEATPTANGVDTITDFIEGAAGDFLNIAALDATFTGTLAVATLAGAGGTFTSLAGSAAAGDVDVLILLDTSGFANVGAAEDEYCATLADVTDDDGAIIIYFDSATSTVKAAFDAAEGADSSGGVTVIAEFTSLGSADLTTFTADNFVIA
jgi:Ca2+-binding RTX toxin-like protein